MFRETAVNVKVVSFIHAVQNIFRTVQEGEDMEQKTAVSISFYVAGCMEFENMAECYDNLTLEQAVVTYKKIRERNAHNLPGIGFILHDPALSDYSDIHWPLFQGKRILWEQIEIIPAYAEHPLVQKAIKEMEAQLPKLQKAEAQRNRHER